MHAAEAIQEKAKVGGMSDLVARAFEDEETAEAARKTLADLGREKVVELDDAVVTTRDENGRVGPHQTFHPARIALGE